MGEKKTKIVLDADVINHFVRGGELSLLPKIFPEFQYIVLDVVKKELPMLILSELMAHLQSSVFKLSKDLIDSIHEEGIVAYTS